MNAPTCDKAPVCLKVGAKADTESNGADVWLTGPYIDTGPASCGLHQTKVPSL